MWSLLEKITVQVTKYSTFLGQIWYVLVFLFRLIVVVTLGGEAYGDEQSAFKCSTKLVGCENICYDEFAKMSHLRFWSFQILAVTTPTVFFHFYTTYVSGEIQKLRDSEDELQVMEQGERKAMSSKPNNRLFAIIAREKVIAHKTPLKRDLNCGSSNR